MVHARPSEPNSLERYFPSSPWSLTSHPHPRSPYPRSPYPARYDFVKSFTTGFEPSCKIKAFNLHFLLDKVFETRVAKRRELAQNACEASLLTLCAPRRGALAAREQSRRDRGLAPQWGLRKCGAI